MKDYVRMTCSNGEVFDIPYDYIVDKRADTLAMKHYDNIDNYYKVYDEEYESGLNANSLVLEWAKENLCWKDVKLFAIRMNKINNEPTDYEADWKKDLEVVYH